MDPIVRLIEDGGGAMFFCHGCQAIHTFRIKANDWSRRQNQPVWKFSGNMESPTFTPTLLVPGDGTRPLCRMNIKDGVIEYLDDCEHELRGKAVAMKSVPGLRDK